MREELIGLPPAVASGRAMVRNPSPAPSRSSVCAVPAPPAPKVKLAPTTTTRACRAPATTVRQNSSAVWLASSVVNGRTTSSSGCRAARRATLTLAGVRRRGWWTGSITASG